MISKELSATLGFAVREAKKRRHEYVCVEHVLFAILHDPDGKLIIEGCGGDIENLKLQLESFFAEKLETLEDSSEYVLQQTISFQRMITRAVNHAKNAEKKEVTIGDILASIFLEEESNATYFLQTEGLSRLNIVEFLSHNFEPSKKEQKNKKGKESEKENKNDPLELYTVDLIDRAKIGKLDPLIGRAKETKRVIQVLCRRRKNNPVLVGEPGVGKTALAEGLAQQIVSGEVPDLLRNTKIYSLDLGALLAGTKFRGDFEKRLKEVLSSLADIDDAILFIDEIHTIIGAGATSGGSMDASNILKPAISSGDLRCMGSTTFDEYKNQFTKDRAFSRRFEKIEVNESSIDETIEILKGLRSRYEEHHKIKYSDDSLEAAAKLSSQYLNDRFLPDKAIDVIDETGAYLKIYSKNKKTILPKDVELVISEMAKIPAKSVSSSDRLKLELLEKKMLKVIYGQDEAITSVVTAIKRSRAGLGTPEKPVGSFLFTGPTGVGKTEVAKQLAHNLGVEFVRFDMSEYMEKHAVARLIGSPPGYVGFEQGGLLTEQISRTPHCVLLMDEIEKAHPDIYNILLQIMDYATLTDNNGKKADFRNVIIIMASNAGAREMTKSSIGFGDSVKDTGDKGKAAVEKLFSPEFRNRLDTTVSFDSLNVTIMEKVVDKFIGEFRDQLKEKSIKLSLSKPARKYLAEKGYDKNYGARPLGRLIQSEIKDKLVDQVLFGKLSNGGKVNIGFRSGELTFSVKEK
ncbi:MAG: ATP-dependent Clp protease ATP-binding subunit ClpA [Desulfobacterales bacterium]|nr:ATP-dependent Clp protease ATP-binding subunit ClpA [Desulfobacterales bacterium]MCP4160011.1 ATP-dependent Clp protease ATP-binding subunit ClpA [Deltaproteobacteria bacterium]